MGWSDILGAIGTVAGGASGLLGGAGGTLGDIGKIAGLVGGAANLGGQIAASSKSQQLQDTATQGAQRALSSSLSLSQQQAKEESDAFNKAMGLIPQETTAYNKTLATLGPASATPMFDVNTVENRAQQLMPMYMQQADRDMQKAFGDDMGRLMSSGTDTSTYGIQARAAAADTGATLHQNAYNKAYTDALAYATGIYEEQSKGHQQQMTDRATALKEATDPYTTAYGDYAGLFGKGGAASSDLSTAGTLSELLAKYAGVGAQSTATGAAGSALKQAVSDGWSGVKDLFGNPFGTTPSNTTTDPYAYIGSGGTSTYTTASGRDY
jgi:hypothetical protein